MEKYLGIDGGASKTTFALANEAGYIEKIVKLGSSNPVDLGIDKACRVLDEGIRKILDGEDYKTVRIFAGISGGISGSMKEQISRFLSGYGFLSYKNGSDAENIVAAGLKRSDGIAVIMGTGSCAFVKKENKLIRLDGLGYLFSHGGSGYDIANQGIRAALMSEDGTGEKTCIRDLILKRTGHKSVTEDLYTFYKIGKKGIASFAPLVFEAYRLKDKVSSKILKKNMCHVAHLITTGGKLLEGKDGVNVILVGGLTAEIEILMPMILEEIAHNGGKINYRLKVFNGDVVKGALLLAGLKARDIRYAEVGNEE